MAKSVVIKIDGDNSEYKAVVNDTDKQTKKMGSSAVAATAKIAGAAAAVVAVGVALKAVITKAAAFEDIGVQFEVLTGSATLALGVLEDLKEFSASTPFKFEEIANAGKLLLAFGTDAGDVKERLREIGDVSAATGANLSDIATIYGQVQGAGKLTGERLNQLQEKSINIAPAIAKVFGVAESNVRALVSSGVVSFDKFAQAFESLSATGGIAFGGLEKKSKTLNGKLSTLSDNWDLFSAAIGKKFLPAAKLAADALTGMVKAATIDDTAKNNVKKLTEEIEILAKKIEKGKAAGRFTLPEDSLTGYEQSDLNKLQDQLDAQLEIIKKSDEEKASVAAESASKKAAIDQANLDRETELAEKILEVKKIGETDSDVSLEALQLLLEEQSVLKQEAQLKELSDKGTHQEALNKIELAGLKKQEKYAAAKVKADATFAQQKVAIAQQASSLVLAIFGNENKAAFVIAQGAAVAQAFLDKSKADLGSLAASRTLPPVISEGYLAKSLAANNIQFGLSLGIIGAQTVQGFENGGVIGGFQGASIGGDNRTIRARDGEMFLNAEQQRNLFDNINNGAIGGGGEVDVTLSMNENIMDFIDAEVVRRRATGTSAI